MNIDSGRLDTLLADIEKYITQPKMHSEALEQLSSIRDYAVGDFHVCSAEAALENCLQLRDYFSAAAPASVLENINRIAQDIREFESRRTPFLLKILKNPWLWILIGIGAVVMLMATKGFGSP